MYEFEPAPGVKISKIVGLADDLAMALKSPSIRVVAPIPGKGALGIEIPNANRQPVVIRDVVSSQDFSQQKGKLTLALGKDTMGKPVVANLARMPHLLIAGATGTGKSVCLNAIVVSLLYRTTPEEVRLLLIDPKRIELSSYEGIPHLLHPVVTDVKKANIALKWAVTEMQRRYELLTLRGVRSIDRYNQTLAKTATRRPKPTPGLAPSDGQDAEDEPLPYLVIIIDELADLMMIASREVEESIIRLAQMARAAGIHLILATQRPSVDVLTGIIKANIPARISFQVSSRVDSRTILDANGAEALLGAGDMLMLPPGTAKLQRIHGAYVSEAEIRRITEFLRKQRKPSYDETVLEYEERSKEGEEDEEDEKYEEAVRLVLETRQPSISMLQRRLRVGYNRAARMIEMMERQGLVSHTDGTRPREVLPSR
jgi:S-DNA-T family DNA segregation ATPase FtsK/SpoIIIE